VAQQPIEMDQTSPSSSPVKTSQSTKHSPDSKKEKREKLKSLSEPITEELLFVSTQLQPSIVFLFIEIDVT
jgi:hypothetical protein